MRPEQSKEIIFVDDSPAVFSEHQVWLNGKYQFFTCIGDDCPLCKKKESSRVFALTAIDKTPWTDRAGNIHTNNLVMFVGKMNVAEILKIEKVRRGTLAGMKYNVRRSEKYAPTVGDNFSFISSSEIEASNFNPIDYVDVFSPLSKDDLEVIARQI